MAHKTWMLCLLFWLGCYMTGYAQQDGKLHLKGVVIDAQTEEPVPFANLGLLGTVAGVASDMDGRFELSIPPQYALHKVRVSAVGYATVEYKAHEFQDKPDFIIRLRPVTYGIGEVDVYGQLLIYKKMLQNVVANINKNYIDVPYNYEGYFKHAVRRGEEEKVKEATVTVYDSEGYNRTDAETAFKNIHYKYNEVRRNRPVTSVFDGLTCMDDILTSDMVRHTRNVLDIVNSRDYKLTGKAKTLYEGDSVQIISYTAVKPTLSTTGTPSVRTYSGEIYINLKDFAVLKNVTRITSEDFNALGRHLIAVDEQPKSEVKTEITTTYKKWRSVYFLSGVNIEYTYDEGEIPVQGNMEFVTTRVKMTNPEIIEGRIYYEDIRENENFWNRYSTYFEEE